MCRALRLAGTAVPQTYEAAFQRAVYTFKHQRVYDPQSRAMVHLRPLPPRGLDPSVLTVPGGSGQLVEGGDHALDFLGPLLPQQQCFLLATGGLGACGCDGGSGKCRCKAADVQTARPAHGCLLSAACCCGAEQASCTT